MKDVVRIILCTSWASNWQNGSDAVQRMTSYFQSCVTRHHFSHEYPTVSAIDDVGNWRKTATQNSCCKIPVNPHSYQGTCVFESLHKYDDHSTSTTNDLQRAITFVRPAKTSHSTGTTKKWSRRYPSTTGTWYIGWDMAQEGSAHRNEEINSFSTNNTCYNNNRCDKWQSLDICVFSYDYQNTTPNPSPNY